MKQFIFLIITMMMICIADTIASQPSPKSSGAKKAGTAKTPENSDANANQDEFKSQDPGELKYEAEEHHYRNHGGLFLGVANNSDAGTTQFAIGLDYELKFPNTNPVLGLGLIAEASLGKHNEYLFAMPLFLHPYNNLKLFIAPGYIYASETEEVVPTNKFKDRDYPMVVDEEDISYSSGHLLMRFGTGWDFHIGERFSITPSVSMDLVQVEMIWVFGVSAGFAF